MVTLTAICIPQCSHQNITLKTFACWERVTQNHPPIIPGSLSSSRRTPSSAEEEGQPDGEGQGHKYHHRVFIPAFGTWCNCGYTGLCTLISEYLPGSSGVDQTLKIAAETTATVTTGGTCCECSSGICCKTNPRHKQRRDADTGLQLCFHSFKSSLLQGEGMQREGALTSWQYFIQLQVTASRCSLGWQ